MSKKHLVVIANERFHLKEWMRETCSQLIADNAGSVEAGRRIERLGFKISTTEDCILYNAPDNFDFSNLISATISKNSKKTREYDPLSEYAKNRYNDKKKTIDKPAGFDKTTRQEFIEWYKNYEPRKCFYCHLTEEETKKLFKLRGKNCHGGKRGNNLEIDRKKPDESYDNLENLVLACYWCNNAKTKFFQAGEFRSIGGAIVLELRKILNENF